MMNNKIFLALLLVILLGSHPSFCQNETSGYTYKYFGIQLGYIKSDRLGIFPGTSEFTEATLAPVIGLVLNPIDNQVFQLHLELNYSQKGMIVMDDTDNERYNLNYTYYQFSPNFRFRHYRFHSIKPFFETGVSLDFMELNSRTYILPYLNLGFGLEWINENWEYHLRSQYQAGINPSPQETIGRERRFNRLGAASITFGLMRRF